MTAKKKLNIALVQTSLHWQDKTANLAMLEEKIFGLSSQVDLIVLPEMFTTGFTMNAGQVAEPMNLHTTKWMQQMAEQTSATITGSFVVKEKTGVYNRLLWVSPDKSISYYDKRHLFRMADEDQNFQMGKERKVFECHGWKVMPLVCYDLRFPVWSRNKSISKEMEYDLLIYVANWPSARVSAWDILLKARAVENLSYSLGVNRVGEDGNGITYSGHSGVYDYKGDTVLFLDDSEAVEMVSLDFEELKSYRKKFPAWMDADTFEIRP